MEEDPVPLTPRHARGESLDGAGPSSAGERQAAIAAWRSLPVHVRRAVVNRARAGEPQADRAAAEIGRRYAVAVLTPGGPAWWRRSRWSPAWTPALVGVAALLVVAAFWAHGTGVAWSDLRGALLLAAVLLVFAAMNRRLRRTLWALAGPEDLSGGRRPSG